MRGHRGLHERSGDGAERGSSRVANIGLFVALLVFLIPIHLALQPYAFDDAYIHIRIARNLLHDAAPYFNAGEAVNGSSSAGWTWALALWLGVFGNRPLTLGLLEALLTAVGAVLWVRLVVPAFRTTSVLITGIAACGYCALVLVSSVGCMETPLALLLVGAGAHLYFRRRHSALFVFAAASFVRPELVVVLALFMIHAVAFERWPWPRVGAWIIAGALPFTIYDLWFFGSVLPHTARAKTLVFAVTRWQALESLVASAVPFPAASWLPSSPRFKASYLALAGICILAGTVVALLRDGFGRRRAAFLLLAAGGASIAAAYVANHVFLHAWYVPLFTVSILFGLAAVLAPARSRVGLAGLSLAALPFLAQGAETALAAATTPALYEHFVTGARVRRYIALGRELGAAYPGARLLSSEIGGLGYGFRGNVIDAVGLVSPQALAYHPLRVPEERSDGRIGAIPPRLVEKTMPELIVSHPVFVQALLDDPVLEDYDGFRVPLLLDEDRRRAGDPPLWGARNLLVWVRRDVAERDPDSAWTREALAP